MAVNDMQNFVFKTRNPEYALWVWGIISAIGISSAAFLDFIKFMSSLEFYICIMLTLSFFIGAFIINLFTSTIEVSDKMVSVKKSFIAFIYYKYEWKYEKRVMEFSTYGVKFINNDEGDLYFYEDTHYDSDDEWEYSTGVFMIRTLTDKRVILGYNDFTKFKESLEKWDNK